MNLERPASKITNRTNVESAPSDAMTDTMTNAAPSEFFEGTRGTKLFFRSWAPLERPRAVLMVVHGFKAHSGNYAWVGEQLAQHGFATLAFDLRGHGRSGGDRFWVETFDDYVRDLDAFSALVHARHPGLPVFLLGHSAGAVVSSLFALDHGSEIAGLIAESSAFELPAPGFVLDLMKGLEKLAPHLGVLKLGDELFSRDPAKVEAMKNDPLINHEAGPAHTLAELARADARLQARLGDLTTPLLLLHGMEDEAARPQGSVTLHDGAGSSDKELKLYDGTLHDPLNDLGKEQVLADIVAWMSARMSHGLERARQVES